MNIFEKAANPFLFILFFALFIVSAFFVSLFSFLGKRSLRSAIKPIPVFSLSALMMAYSPDLLILCISFAIAACGDWVYVYKQRWTKLVAPFLFFVSHVLAIFYFIKQKPYLLMEDFLGLFICVSLIYALIYYADLPFFKKKPFIIVPAIYYGTALLRVIQLLHFSTFSPWLLLASLGMAIYLFSDVLIGIHTAVHEIKRRHFWVIFLYLIGQGLVAIGYLLAL